MKRLSRAYAAHVIARLRSESQRLLPSSLRTVPRGFCAHAVDCVDPRQIAAVDAPHVITRRPPNTIDATVDWEFTTRLSVASPATFVATLEYGRALEHAVLSNEGTLIADLSIEPGVVPGNAVEHSALHRRTIPRLETFDAEIVVASAFGGSDNYFHWMTEVLPRLGILARSGRSATHAAVLVNALDKPFHRETLSTLGVAPLLDATAHPYVRARELVVPSLPGIMGDVTRASCDFLRDTFLPSTSDVATARIYITRSDARYRRLRNEREVRAVLDPLGFVTVDCTELSVGEQAELFASASVVIAPHGAGLTNIVFCRPGAKVVEFFSPAYVNGCYWGIANHVGLEYWYLLGEGERPAQDALHAHAADDLEVNIATLRRLMDAAQLSRSG